MRYPLSAGVYCILADLPPNFRADAFAGTVDDYVRCRAAYGAGWDGRHHRRSDANGNLRVEKQGLSKP